MNRRVVGLKRNPNMARVMYTTSPPACLTDIEGVEFGVGFSQLGNRITNTSDLLTQQVIVVCSAASNSAASRSEP